jgi:isopenicillin N synthase-like dioxygenase
MATANALPTIDLTPLREGSAADKRAVACEIDDACTEIGFFLVAGHGVAQRLIAETRQAASVIRAVPGSAAQTRTPTACCVSTSREEPTSRASLRVI